MTDQFAEGDLLADDELLELLRNSEAMDDLRTMDGLSDLSDADQLDSDVINYEGGAEPRDTNKALFHTGADIEPLSAEIKGNTDDSITNNDTTVLMIAEYRKKEASNHHTVSMNSFYSTGLPQIITTVFHIEGIVKNERRLPEDADISEIHFRVQPTQVDIRKPITYGRSGAAAALTPAMAHKKGCSYEVDISMNADITLTAHLDEGKGTIVRKETVNNIPLTSFPCCVGSVECHTFGKTREDLKQMQEDPNMPKGYFLLRGGMWSIEANENLTTNNLHVHKTTGYQNEMIRATFISKPGDAFENSFQTIIKMLVDGAIVIELTLGKDEKITIPFYLMFRAFGMISDREIVDNIVNGVDNADPVTKKLLTYLDAAFSAKDSRFAPVETSTNPSAILNFISETFKKVDDPNAAKKNRNVQKYRVGWFLNVIDKIFFPHIGVREADRLRKLKFLAYAIRKMLFVQAGILPATDRDGLHNKRVHPAGIALAKMFKTRYNLAVVQLIIRAFMTKIPVSSFQEIRMGTILTEAIRGDKLKESIVSLMSPSKKTGADTASRINPNSIYLKNQLNAIAATNNVTAPKPPVGKSNDRALEMRMVHPSSMSYYCVSSSTDSGEQVGMNKQLAISASISGSSSSEVLRGILAGDTEIITEATPAQISYDNFAIVLVNGNPVGYVRESHRFVARYRKYRRHGLIDRRVSIVWEVRTNEVNFWTDYGRMHRPMIIVYNNHDEYVAAARAGKPIKFTQWIGLTRQHISGLVSGEITMDDLETEGVIEYISPEEHMNTYPAQSVSKFREHLDDVLNQFTHVDDQRSIFGVTALAAVLAGHSNAVRITMQTNQRKQASSWPATNYPYLAIKNTTIAHYVDTPLVGALTDNLTIPAGQNLMVALACHRGHNVEDSVDANTTSGDRGMLCCSQFNVQKAECARESEFAVPNAATTSNINRDANFAKLDGVAAREGAILQRGDVMIAKVSKSSRESDRGWSDQSIVYKKQESARVVGVTDTHNANNERFIKVKTGSYRPLRDGDKVCSRTGNKGIVAKLSPACDMPYTEEGIPVDLIVNVHSIPTRMALNQIGETALGLEGAHDGCLLDGTSMREIDMRKLVKDLAIREYKYAGHQRMYNGKTGEPMDTLVFIGPTHYMRLEKFVIDEQYANSRGVTSPLTFQPLPGKAADGGLRLGEMEKDTMCAQGAMQELHSKFHDDSDGIDAIYCRVCGGLAIANPTRGLYRCTRCNDDARFVTVRTTRTALLNSYRLGGMGVRMKYQIETANRL